MVNEAKEALSKLASGAEVELRYGGTRTERHGYALAQVYVVKGGERIWLQGELVAKGLARVYSFPDNHACVSELLAREAEARELRVRGWLEWRNGPMIHVTHVEQIELLPGDAGGGGSPRQAPEAPAAGLAL